MRHKLKTINPYFNELWNRKKTAELRFNDRYFCVGDTVDLVLWDEENGFSTKSVFARISGITEYPDALKPGWVMLSLDSMINVINCQQWETERGDRLYALLKSAREFMGAIASADLLRHLPQLEKKLLEFGEAIKGCRHY